MLPPPGVERVSIEEDKGSDLSLIDVFVFQLKRSRSVEDVSELPPAGVEPVTTEADKRLVKGSLNPQRLHFPHGKPK